MSREGFDGRILIVLVPIEKGVDSPVEGVDSPVVQQDLLTKIKPCAQKGFQYLISQEVLRTLPTISQEVLRTLPTIITFRSFVRPFVRPSVRPSVSYKIHEMNYIAVAPHSGSLYIPSKTVSAFCCIIASNSTYLVSQQSKHDFGSTYLPMNLLSRGMEFMSCRFSTPISAVHTYL